MTDIDEGLKLLLAKAKPIEKLAVGVRARNLDISNPPLGFATPYAPNNEAGKKRLETVRDWVFQYSADWFCEKSISAMNPSEMEQYRVLKTKTFDEWVPFVLDNVPLKGFTFDRIASRYRTHAKYFRINDPRGFQIEINAENLLYLISNTDSIGSGKIDDGLIYARIGAQNWLVLPQHMTLVSEITEKEITSDKCEYLKGYISKSKQCLVYYLGEFDIYGESDRHNPYNGNIRHSKERLFLDERGYLIDIGTSAKLRPTDKSMSQDEVLKKFDRPVNISRYGTLSKLYAYIITIGDPSETKKNFFIDKKREIFDAYENHHRTIRALGQDYISYRKSNDELNEKVSRIVGEIMDMTIETFKQALESKIKNG